MGKRFTDTEKWNKPWFRALSSSHKHGWNYICDRCDNAGIVSIDRPLADFQIGETVDWDTLVDAADGRIVKLEGGKWWLVGFIEYQYGVLSLVCQPHVAILRILVEYAKTERVVEDYLKGWLTLKDKDKDMDLPTLIGVLSKNPEKSTQRGSVRGGKRKITAADVAVPGSHDTPEVRAALEAWLEHKAGRGEGYKDVGYLGRMTTKFGDAAAFVAAVEFSIGVNYGGIFPAKGNSGQQPKRRPHRYQGD